MGDKSGERTASDIILAAAADGVLAVDEQNVVRYSNHAAEELLGRAAGSLTGSRFGSELVPGRAGELAVSLPGEADRVLDLRVSATVLNGEKLRVASMRDMTHRKQSERSLEAALERQGAALAVAGHQLRGPLAAIGVLAHVLADDQITLKPADRLTVATRVSDHAARLQSLVTRLLASAQIDAGAAKPARGPVQVAAAIAEQLSAASQLGAQQASVSCPDDLIVLADGDDLAMMLSNYLDNALTYAAPPVSIRAAAEAGVARIEVSDGGPGVTDSFIPQLFERFVRAPGAQQQGEGVGLGLWIVRTLARANQGDAWYEPGPGGGSRFCLRLPLAPVAGAGP